MPISMGVRLRDLPIAAMLAVAVIVVGPAAAHGATFTKTAVADAHAVQGRTTAAPGTARTLPIDLAPRAAAYVRFSVDRCTGPATKAVLRIHTSSARSAGTPNGPLVFAASTSWTERGLRWASRPAQRGSRLADLGRVARNSWYRLDVTRAVTRPGSVAFALVPQHADAMLVDSRHTTRRPQLDVTCPTASDTATLAAPEGLEVQSVTDNGVELTWGAVDGAAAYQVFHNSRLLASTANTYYDVVDLPADTGHEFAVRAVGADRSLSALSDPIVTRTLRAADTSIPSAPSTLRVVSKTTSSVSLAWVAATDGADGSGIASYLVLRDDDVVGTTTSTSLTVTGLSPGTSYVFTVRAVDVAGNHGEPATIDVTTSVPPPDLTAPSAPSGLAASATSSSSIQLTWNASTDSGGSGVAAYRVFRGATQVATPTGTSYTDTGLSSSTAYSYTVRAVDGAGNVSAASGSAGATTSVAVDSTAPSVPTGLTAGATGSTTVDLSWDASTDSGGSGLLGYRVYRDGVLVTTGSGTSWTDTGRSPSTAYVYSVRAVDVAGNASAASASAGATTDDPPDTTAPSVPTGVVATATSSSTIEISWNASTDVGGSVESYELYRDGANLYVPLLSGTTYVDAGRAASTTFVYTVRAVDDAGNRSAASTSASATTHAVPDTTAPTIPTGLTATAMSSSTIQLSWAASADSGSGVAGYRLYRGGALLTTRSGTNYTDISLAAASTYTYTVRAVDNVGNASADSDDATATTEPAGAAAFPPPVPFATKIIGMSAPKTLWTQRLGEVGASGVTARRIFADLTAAGTDQLTVIDDAIDDGMMPVISYKVPNVDTLIAGGYDGWLANLRAQLVARNAEMTVTFWHEPHGDMTPAQFRAGSAKFLDLVDAPKLAIGPILNGWLLDNQVGTFASYSDATLLDRWEFVAVDSYQNGTFESPGSKLPGRGAPQLANWLASVGHADMPIGIGEYNGFTAAAISNAGTQFLGQPQLWFALAWNSTTETFAPLEGDRLTAFQATKADPRVRQ